MHYPAQSHGSIEGGMGGGDSVTTTFTMGDSVSSLHSDVDATVPNHHLQDDDDDDDDMEADDDPDANADTSTYDRLPLGRPIAVSEATAVAGTLQRRRSTQATASAYPKTTTTTTTTTTPSDEYCSTCDESETDSCEDSSHHDGDENAIDTKPHNPIVGTVSIASNGSNESEKEIFIDFKPRISPAVSPRRLQQQHQRRKRLQKQLSEGELIHQQRQELANNTKNSLLAMASASEKDLKTTEAETTAHPRTDAYEYRDEPIVDEGVCEKCAPPPTAQQAAQVSLPATAAAANDRRQAFRKRSLSMEGSATPTTATTTASEADDDDDRDNANDEAENNDTVCATRSKHPNLPNPRISHHGITTDGTNKVQHTKSRSPPSPFMDELSVVSRAQSNFPSTDSLANDLTRDHSDGIWNESQATVLQADRR